MPRRRRAEEVLMNVEQSILVGVTGAHENSDALRYAVTAARRDGHKITLVHAVHPILPPPPPSVLLTDDTWMEVGESIVRDVRHELEGLLGDEATGVEGVARQGSPAAVFSELTETARLVVLQHQDRSRLQRLFTGSTVASVAAHSHVPVVSVPSTSSPRSPSGVIAVGVRADGGPREVLQAAFAEADARQSQLRVVHGWKVPAAYEDILVRWTAEDDERIRAALRHLLEKYPDVDVSVDVQHEWPADVLVDAGAEADLVVVGRHDGLVKLARRLGSIARAAVTHAPCPVMIVPV
jgi:nucleotide-binding universal stress UspA family protein